MSAADLESTRRLLAGRYEILQELGRGGMGAVYLAATFASIGRWH